MLILFTFAIAVIVSIVASMLFKNTSNNGKILRTILNCLLIMVVAIVCYGNRDYFGVFGNPGSLNPKIDYRILSVVQLAGKNTAVILVGQDGLVVPIAFRVPIKADTNGLYRLVGDNVQNYTLTLTK